MILFSKRAAPENQQKIVLNTTRIMVRCLEMVLYNVQKKPFWMIFGLDFIKLYIRVVLKISLCSPILTKIENGFFIHSDFKAIGYSI